MNNSNLFYQHISSMKNEENEQSESSVEDPHNLSNLTIPKEKTILPCYTTLRSGKCLKGTEYTYSHFKTELIKGWQDMFTELKASPLNPNKHLTPANTKNTFDTPSKTLQSIVEDVVTPNISEKS